MQYATILTLCGIKIRTDFSFFAEGGVCSEAFPSGTQNTLKIFFKARNKVLKNSLKLELN